MSLWSEYREERGEAFFIEEENGFASYSIEANGEECYLQDIYVRPAFRKTGLATELADKVCSIGKEKGCKVLTGSVVVGSKDDTVSMKVFLAYGMKLLLVRDNIIYVYKEL